MTTSPTLLYSLLKCFFNSESIANVLSYDKIANLSNVRITTDTVIEKAIFVHFTSPNTNTTHKFSSCRDGLYYFDATHLLNDKTKSVITDYLSFNSKNKNVLY